MTIQIKSRIVLLCGAAAMALLCLGIFGKACFLMDRADHVTAIWHEDEAFILVGTYTAGINEGLGKIVLNSFLSIWGAGRFAHKFHEDLTVFHIRGKTLETYHLKDFGHGGWGYPFNGELYIYNGNQTMRFTGTNFTQVSQNEAFKITKQFPPQGAVKHSMEEELKKEGWESNDSLDFRFTNGPFTIQLRDQHIIVTLKENEPYAPQSIEVEGRLGHADKEILFHNENNRYRWVSKATYTKATANR